MRRLSERDSKEGRDRQKSKRKKESIGTENLEGRKGGD